MINEMNKEIGELIQEKIDELTEIVENIENQPGASAVRNLWGQSIYIEESFDIAEDTNDLENKIQSLINNKNDLDDFRDYQSWDEDELQENFVDKLEEIVEDPESAFMLLNTNSLENINDSIEKYKKMLKLLNI